MTGYNNAAKRVIGYWLLVIGRWSLVTGCWSLVTRLAPRFRLLLSILCLFLMLICVGCGSRSRADGLDEQFSIRTPRPTFTPSPASPDSGQSPQEISNSGEGNSALGAGQSQGDPNQAQNIEAKAVINAPLVNVRTGPGTNYEIVAEMERGSEFVIVGQNNVGDWWEVCCVNGQKVWVIDQYVDTSGPIEQVLSPRAAPVPQQGAVPSIPDSELSFQLVGQEQFPETNVIRIYLYVYTGSDALAGYKVRVYKNGTELANNTISFGPQAAFTWPVADPRQRFQNMKLELPGQQPEGTWEIQLADGNGQPAGPIATFLLRSNDSSRELYIRYEKK